MNWFNKVSDIQIVSIFTSNDPKDFYRKVSHEVMSKSKKKVDYVTNHSSISSSSILNTKKPDLAICIHNTSLMRKEYCEITYLKDDKASKELAIKLIKQFKKIYKNKEIGLLGIGEGDDGWYSVQSVKNLKRKIFIKPESDMEVEEFSNVLLNFLGKI